MPNTTIEQVIAAMTPLWSTEEVAQANDVFDDYSMTEWDPYGEERSLVLAIADEEGVDRELLVQVVYLRS